MGGRLGPRQRQDHRPRPRTGTDPAAPPTPAERRTELLNAIMQSSGLTYRELARILHRLQHLE
jgi:hypothetical protein